MHRSRRFGEPAREIGARIVAALVAGLRLGVEAVTLHIATDIGGTFTDLAAWDSESGVLVAAKTPTSRDFTRGTLDAIDTAGVDVAHATQFRHGSTIAINAVLEGTGAKSILVATEGFGDVLELGRGNRPNPFVLNAPGHRVLVPDERRFEVPERVLASGHVHQEVDESALRVLLERLRLVDFEAAAVCFLHSYANPAHETIVAGALREAFPEAYVVASHEVCREAREFERTSTAVVHAYVGPIVRSYLQTLASCLGERGFAARVLLMQSNGGLMSEDDAISRPGLMMESGPASGVMGTAELARALGVERVVAFDMGGTTAKASLVEQHEPSFLRTYYIGGYDSGLPLLAPVIDIHEVGAGGGSIAWLDDAGAIHVGPRSAGSQPGPMCYGMRGSHPTVCDADLVLGRLHPGDTLGGSITLDVEAARSGITGQIAKPLGLSLERAAHGIVTIANTVMAQAVRKVSIERGRDPREFVLVGYGGAGPMHAADIARELGITQVVIPPAAGVFSSLGMLFSPLRTDLNHSVTASLSQTDLQDLEREAASLIERLRREISAESSRASEGVWIAVRYRGQEHSRRINVANWTVDTIRATFEEHYRTRYGYVLSEGELEVTALGAWREVLQDVPSWHAMLPSVPAPAWVGAGSHRTYFPDVGWASAATCWRPSLRTGDKIDGPALIVEPTSTSVLAPNDTAVVGQVGELILRIGRP